MKKKYGLKRPPIGAGIDYAQELNPQQLEAVTAPDGPALVIAGAGSGKTRVVTYRVAYLLEQGIKPEEILLLTFTKKAAEEMLRRVEALVQRDLSRIWGGTFHHVGNRVLRRHISLLGFSQSYTILDRDDSRVLMDSVIREMGVDTGARRFPRGKVLLDIIGYARNAGIDLEEAVDIKASRFLKLISEIREAAVRYARRKKSRNYLDFDDLLIFFDRLLSEYPDMAARYRERFKYILVDEYQDTNRIQATIIDALLTEKHNIMVVGDDSQSIYSFRAAEFKNIRDFPQRYPGCRIYTVETNYRSTPEILRLTNRVLDGAEEGFRKRLQAVKNPGHLPVLIRPENVYEQADFVAQRILELIEEGINPKEIAVLYRSHYHSMEIQMELTRREIPYTVRSGLRFFEQAHIKDILAYLKVIDNPLDEIAWKRVMVRLDRIGPRTAEKVWEVISRADSPLQAAAGQDVAKIPSSAARDGWEEFVGTLKELAGRKHSGPAEMIEIILESGYDYYLQNKYSNYANRREDLNQLSNYARRYRDLEHFLSELAMIGGLNVHDVYNRSTEDMVVLSTVHQSKGLEWDAVFLIWLAEGKFPPAASYGDDAAMEEERRLFYVAATRCRDELYLIEPLVARSRSGGETLLRPSRFLEEIPPDCYEEWDLFDI